MGIQVSIIIPSHNRYPLNKLALYSLKKQKFDLSKVEVILLDDASKDETQKLKDKTFPFRFKYIRNNTNKGLSKTRNIGIKAATGKILIIMDAEVITDPHFIANHCKYHVEGKDPVVVTSGHISDIYSYLFPNFNERQLTELYKRTNSNISLKKRIEKKLKEHLSAQEILANNKKLTSLIGESDIRNFSKIRELSFGRRRYDIKDPYKFSDHLDFPWAGIIGLNHSVTKKTMQAIGGYDEGFLGWGLEDLEFGYRLYKGGVTFVFDSNIRLYHQEHPINRPRRKKEELRNMIHFQNKHPDLEVCLLSFLYGKVSWSRLGKARKEYLQFKECLTGQYAEFIGAMTQLLRGIPVRKIKRINSRYENELQAGLIDPSSDIVQTQKNELKKLGRVNELVSLFEELSENQAPN